MHKTLPQIVESTIIAASGGQYVDESIVQREVVEAKVNEARAVIIADKWRKNNQVIHPDWQLEYFPEYNEDMQDEDLCSTYYCPATVFFGKNTDGVLHVGAPKCPENFQRVWNRNALASRMQHPVMKAGRVVLVLKEGDYIRFYANRKIIDPKIILVPYSPEMIPTYNKAKDRYPLDPDSIEMVEKFVIDTYLSYVLRTPPDRVSDSTPTYVNPLLNRKI